jgi:hypothetical protein
MVVKDITEEDLWKEIAPKNGKYCGAGSRLIRRMN